VGRWLCLGALYLACGLAFVIAVDQTGDWSLVFLILLGLGSIALGWGTGRSGLRGVWLCLLLSSLVVLMAIPFGDPNEPTDSPVAVLAIAPVVASLVLVLVSAAARSLYERRRGSDPPTAA
jgi:peptidoglycan/LPS O-acetylase OafA/YrhL